MASELRSKWWSRPLGHLLWLAIWGICCTLRKRMVNDGDPDMGKKQVIIALWHNRTFVPCHFYKYVVRGSITMSMLTSASKDGAMLATVAEDYGMRAVRGSSNRRGVAGFMDLLSELKAGYCMCITPDGPKGPRYKCHPGVIRAAAMSGLPIIPVRIEIPHCWRISSAWDGFIIPKPFSRVELHWGKPIRVPHELNDAEQKRYCALLEEALTGGAPDFPSFAELREQQNVRPFHSNDSEETRS